MITENQKTIGVPEGKDGQPYYLPDDMADKTIEWLHGVRAQAPDKPWFVYFSTGCSHASTTSPRSGPTSTGAASTRAGTPCARRSLSAEAPRGGPGRRRADPRNDAFPAWDFLDADQRRLYARQMEVYAGYSENADHNVGRVLDAIAEMGELEDTLVIWIWGDNGSSMEGTLTGSFNELTMQNGIP